MKAIIVFPKISNQNIYNSKLIRVPLGVLSIAHRARMAGAEITIIDQRRSEDAQAELKRILHEQRPVCVAFSVMTGNQIHFALELSRFVKETSDAVTVWGGVHPTLEPKTTVAHPCVDFVVVGEGEDIFVELLYALDGCRLPFEVPGIAYVNEVGVPTLTASAPLPSINEIGGIDYGQLLFREYVEASTFFNFETNIILPVETSRGCPFNCTFCTEPVMNRQWRCMDTPVLTAELQRIQECYGIRAIAFVDDLFFVHHSRSEEIVDAIIEANLNIEWYANVRAEYVVKHGVKFFSKVSRAGCRSLTMGAEGGTDSILKRVRKVGVTVDALFEANRILKDVGIAPHFSGIIGYPQEEPNELLSTVMMACRLLGENQQAKVSLNKLIPTPGSLILTECLRSGFSAPKGLDEWAEVFYTDASAWLVPESAALLERLVPMCELIGMVHAGSHAHDALFTLVTTIAGSGPAIHALFSSRAAAEALDCVMNKVGGHFRRYPVFGDERSWQHR